MKAQYSRARPYKGHGSDPSFTLGDTYLVLGVRFQPEGRPTMITVQRDSDRTPVLVELHCFDVVDPAIPGGWCFSDFGCGSYRVEPKEFGGKFWDRFHDGDPEAKKTFERAVEKLKAFRAQNAG
ncbi:hypothetical protein [Burkholderia sp. WSM2232]|uniref:hypothetical protein n=1 Tax=Burkholderia sp. WSM2232 TaxID=944436 RepID=UPI0006845A3D|nr:hypothetical protein [Burkholderia sp. WSM2232]